MFKRLVLFPILLLLTIASAAIAEEERHPNVLFFLVDDLGWRDVGCYGSPFHETPHIDRLAQQGVRFTQAYAACHVCSPTRASIMTGKYPARLHLTDWLSGRREFPFQKLQNAEIHQSLPLQEVTLAEALKAHGYQTAHIGKWHLGEDPHGPLAQGFDMQVPRWNKGWPKAGYYAPFKFEGLSDAPGQYLTDRLTDVAEEFIEANKDKPFFLYLSHFAVHDPIHGRPDLVEKYRRKLAKMKRPAGGAFVLEGNPDDADPLSREALDKLIDQPSHRGFKVLPKSTVKIKQHQDNIHFAAMVEAMDESLGRVLAKLDALGLQDDTIVVFYADNGGMSAANFGRPNRIVRVDQLDRAFSTSNLPLRGAKGWLYEGGVRVPGIVKWPGKSKPGITCDQPIMSTDLYPTLLEMAGLPPLADQTRDGVSFAAALKGEAFQRGAVYWHFPHYSNHGMQSPGGAIVDGDYKLLEYFENGSVQLFNLKTDIGEQHDLALAQPEKAKQLLAKLQQWRRDVGARMMPANPNYDPKATIH